jgi:uncharacterized protein YdhG (YjbR/CyaY superfamily)
MGAKFETVDEYIASFPPDVQEKLESVRGAMRAALPGTEERISYGIPTFTLGGQYVAYFSGWKEHLSVYPIPKADAALERQLKTHMAGKGTLKFPLSKPLPLELIGRVAALLLEQRKMRTR